MQLEIWKNGVRESAAAIASEFQAVTVSPSGEGIMELKLNIPIIDLQGYWFPFNRTPTMKLHWVIQTDSSAQRNFPYIAFFNSSQENRCSIGLDNLTDDTSIIAKMNQETCNYEITVKVAVSAETQPFKVIVNRRRQYWVKCLEDWRGELGLPTVKYPEGAWDPVFCTWYAVHAAVTQDWVETTAAEAAKLGFGTYIIDDGWCFDDMKRVSPQTIGSWYEMIGDWQVSAQKFPDFTNHVNRVRAMGMKYMLWVTPFLIGAKSQFYKDYGECVFEGYKEGCYTLDSAKEKSVAPMTEKLAGLMKQYPLDGLKIDFLDHVFPNLEKPRGRETRKFIAGLSKAIRQVKADALIEFRQNYDTPGMLEFATQFRAGDVPFDFLDNFQRMAQIRISIGDGAPVHADPVYWHPNETRENISRHMIASLVGVPMLSMDLTQISSMGKQIITNWLHFYRKHYQAFRHGKWEICFNGASCAWAAVTGEKERIIILNDRFQLGEAIGSCKLPQYILNLTADKLEHSEAKCFDCLGHELNFKSAPSGGYLLVNSTYGV